MQQRCCVKALRLFHSHQALAWCLCRGFSVALITRVEESFASNSRRIGNAAPKARNMKARGKREARRPWFIQYMSFRPEGPKYTRYYAPSGRGGTLIRVPGATRFRACPWLSYPAPLALNSPTRGLLRQSHPNWVTQ